MDAMEVWASLEKVFHLTPRELYDNEELGRLHWDSRNQVNSMSRAEMRTTLSRYVRDVMLSETALDHGGGWENVLAFLDWVDGGME